MCYIDIDIDGIDDGSDIDGERRKEQGWVGRTRGGGVACQFSLTVTAGSNNPLQNTKGPGMYGTHS